MRGRGGVINLGKVKARFCCRKGEKAMRAADAAVRFREVGFVSWLFAFLTRWKSQVRILYAPLDLADVAVESGKVLGKVLAVSVLSAMAGCSTALPIPADAGADLSPVADMAMAADDGGQCQPKGASCEVTSATHAYGNCCLPSFCYADPKSGKSCCQGMGYINDPNFPNLCP